MSHYPNRTASFGLPLRLLLGAALVSAVASFLLFTGAVPTGASHLTGTTATYTAAGDFNEGTLINVEVLPDATNHHLKLLDTGEAFNFIWVAASARGTVVKIDTLTGDVLGEYRTAPQGMATNPSRTTVDANGNVWVGNRNESSGGQGSVTMIGLAENGQCGPSPNTSSGLGDILAWTNAGGADTAGGVSTAEDDCIRHFVRIPGTNVRTMAIDGNNDLWTGGLGNRVHAKVDSITGTVVPGTTFNLGCGGYGGLVDPNGILWSANPGGTILRYDPATSTGVCVASVPGNYGMGIDPNTGHIWVSELGGSNNVFELDPADGSVLNSYPQGFSAQGLAVDGNSHVWVAEIFGTRVAHFAPDPLTPGQHVFVGYATGFNGTTGVAVDAAGKVWASEIGGNSASRIDPALGAVGGGGYNIGAIDLTVSLGAGAGPYNYSDMTGSTLTAPPSAGTWTITHDSGQAGTEWGTITWNDEAEGIVPGDAQLTVEARSSDDNGLTWSAWENVSYGVDLTVPNGQHLQVRVSFVRSSTGESPTLSDLTIRAVDPEVEVAVDIRPTSCPNPLNVRQRGVLPVAILGTADFDVTEIDASTVQLEGVSALRSSLEDVATPFDGPFSDPPDALDCTTEGADGFTDLVLHFDAQSVSGTLGNPADGEVLLLTLTGQLNDGTPIVGADVVRIINRGN